MEERSKSITLYDGGSSFILLYLFGIPLGVIGDFLWNLIAFWLLLPVAVRDKSARAKVKWFKRIIYAAVVTEAGVVIDWAYLNITWKSHILTDSRLWIPAMSQTLQFVCLLLPMVMIALVTGALAYAFFKLNLRQTSILGSLMGFFTAPWLLPTIPYIMGWVVK